ncbi:HipA domain-containing protein [Nibrella viscosa]
MNSNCLYCYGPLAADETDFHRACSRKFFGRPQPPELPYAKETMYELAEQIIRQSITVTGVQPKLSLDIQAADGRERLKLVDLWRRYILKPPYELFPEMTETEDLTMHLAGLFGITTVPHTLIRLETGELAYLTRRIDRTPDGRKLAMEDFCQLAERLTADKYKGSLELVARLIQKHSTQAVLDLVTLYELSLFCFLTGNADMHLKNFSLWCPDDETVALTPAYDLLATKLLLPEDKEETELTLNGKKNRLRITDWAAFANKLGLTEKQQANVHQRFGKRLPGAFQLIDNSFLSDEKKEAYRQLLLERAGRLDLPVAE